MQRRRTFLATSAAPLTVALAIALTGCGTSQESASPSSTSSSPTQAADGPLYPAPDQRVQGLVDKMKAVSFMAGQWKGKGISYSPTGAKTEFEQTESVVYRLSGELMLIEGKGARPDSPDDLIFRAFATARYDAATGQYLWWAASRGGVTEVPLEVRENGFTWSYGSSQFSVRNVATFTETTWSEKSDQSSDGGRTWRPMVELNLTRVG